MDDLMRFFDDDAYIRHLGIELLDHGPGRARARMSVGPQHLNSAGGAHGGAIFSVADAALAVAANSHGRVALATDMSISYCKAVSDGTLVAEACEVSRGGRLARYRIDVVREESGDLVAQAQGTAYLTRGAVAPR